MLVVRLVVVVHLRLGARRPLAQPADQPPASARPRPVRSRARRRARHPPRVLSRASTLPSFSSSPPRLSQLTLTSPYSFRFRLQSGVVSDPAHWHLAQYPHSHAHLAASSASHSTATHWLSSFQDLARELRIDIQVGTIVERAVDDDGTELSRDVEVVDDETGAKKVEQRPVLENVAHYIDWEGNILHRYKKRNLWWCVPFLCLSRPPATARR